MALTLGGIGLKSPQELSESGVSLCFDGAELKCSLKAWVSLSIEALISSENDPGGFLRQHYATVENLINSNVGLILENAVRSPQAVLTSIRNPKVIPFSDDNRVRIVQVETGVLSVRDLRERPLITSVA